MCLLGGKVLGKFVSLRGNWKWERIIPGNGILLVIDILGVLWDRGRGEGFEFMMSFLKIYGLNYHRHQ